MKAVTSISKSGLAEAVATATELKKSDIMKVLTSLAEVVQKEVKKTGKVTLPGMCMVKTRLKPATKAGKRGQGQTGEDRRQGLPCGYDQAALQVSTPM
eukprot:CAMPEP_0204135252 /NCGR_PEP_ID=MMETSP0361-20130328/16135_1 /ASSEMBLY_ACC=CAM_ASM_000343 /TAXON_ID=268821 /ORGANISM="Scrippsiella Hangoei, Strain SHTV-5" /LENGTH=97 /DNA_ID=CAMNT_0051088575 /DNA_START=64 /DNA_END=357 /DNA_ORIENTATION=-